MCGPQHIESSRGLETAPCRLGFHFFGGRKAYHLNSWLSWHASLEINWDEGKTELTRGGSCNYCKYCPITVFFEQTTFQMGSSENRVSMGIRKFHGWFSFPSFKLQRWENNTRFSDEPKYQIVADISHCVHLHPYDLPHVSWLMG